MKTVTDAMALAAAYHRDQVDKAGRPYIVHVSAVAQRLQEYGREAMMAGYLHDTVEDTPITLDRLRLMGYPETVIAAVDSVTLRPGERYLDMVRRAAADPLGRLVKMADNLVNSDEDSLAQLDPKTANRLRGKYARARQVLLEVVGD